MTALHQCFKGQGSARSLIAQRRRPPPPHIFPGADYALWFMSERAAHAGSRRSRAPGSWPGGVSERIVPCAPHPRANSAAIHERSPERQSDGSRRDAGFTEDHAERAAVNEEHDACMHVFPQSEHWCRAVMSCLRSILKNGRRHNSSNSREGHHPTDSPCPERKWRAGFSERRERRPETGQKDPHSFSFWAWTRPYLLQKTEATTGPGYAAPAHPLSAKKASCAALQRTYTRTVRDKIKKKTV
jgi:hypothetical protein